MPGITGIDIKSKSAYGSLRQVTVSFVAWDIRQLEELELLYMRPGYTVLVEWGWAPYLDNDGKLSKNIDYYDIINKTPNKETIFKNLYDDAVEKYKALSKYQKLASVAWKQGFIYILWYPNYQQDDVIYSRESIPGVKYHKGYRSAYKSAVKVYGEYLPKQMTREMGFEQVGIKKADRKAEPTLTFQTIEPKVRREIKRGRKPRHRVYNLVGGIS